MPRVTPDDLRPTLSIWLRFASHWARVAFASKHLVERDKGSDELVRMLHRKMTLSHWEVDKPEPPPHTSV